MASAPPSTVAPSESVSNTGPKKKNRPGKNARAAARAAGTPAPSSNAGVSDTAKADTFASRARSAPQPQPGKFPVVFPTGAGEPTTFRKFSYSPDSINGIIADVHEKYLNNAKLVEFFANSPGYTESTFAADLIRYFILALAQQTVHAHVNTGHVLGDFSTVASTDVFIPSGLRAAVQQFGEFSVPALGIQFVLSDYATTVSSLVHAAKQVVVTEDDLYDMNSVPRLWLPMGKNDRRTAHILAVRLNRYLDRTINASIDIDTLADGILVAEPAAFTNLKAALPNPDRFDFLFTPKATPAAWVTAFSTAGAQAALDDLGLSWINPNAAHLDFNFQTKIEFPALIEPWARKKATLDKFFSLGSGLANKASAVGLPSQMSTVSTMSGVTKINSLVGVSAPEFSLLACFPCSSEYYANYDVVVVTSIPVRIRAIEFTQMDWKD